MNLVDAVVVKVRSEPYQKYNKWWVSVSYNSWGCPGATQLMFDTQAEAMTVHEGFRFLA